MRKCVFKWKADEKLKAWIAADPMSKTKAMCVVCNQAIDISSMGEAALQSHNDRQETQETHGIETVISFCYTFPIF